MVLNMRFTDKHDLTNDMCEEISTNEKHLYLVAMELERYHYHHTDHHLLESVNS